MKIELLILTILSFLCAKTSLSQSYPIQGKGCVEFSGGLTSEYYSIIAVPKGGQFISRKSLEIKLHRYKKSEILVV